MKTRLISTILILSGHIVLNAAIFKGSSGLVKFESNAPLEVIKAQSSKLNGALNTDDRSFAFKIPMNTFEGFNSALQKTHFNENYIETEKFPFAVFEGKVIEEIDFSTPGKHEVRGKGKFTVHGVEQVRIIRCKIEILNDKITITSKFSVLLADHNIKIPTIVAKKIAEEVQVEINTILLKK